MQSDDPFPVAGRPGEVVDRAAPGKGWRIGSLMAAVALAIAVPLVAALVHDIELERARIVDRAQGRARGLAQIGAHAIERQLSETQRLLSVLASRRRVRALDATQCDQIFVDFQKTHPAFTALTTATVDRRLVCSSFAVAPPIAAEVPTTMPESQPEAGILHVGEVQRGFLSGRWVVPVTLVAEQKLLAANETSLAITMHSIGDGVIATDVDGCITRMNPTAERLTGWSLAEARGRRLPEVFRIVNADTRRAVANPVERVMQTGKVVGLANHTILIARDGNEYQIADSAAPILDDAGQSEGSGHIVGIVLVFSDVTEKYALEDAVQREQRFSRQVIDNLPGIFYLYSYPESRLVLWNRQHEARLGFSPAEMKGRHVTDWHVPGTHDKVVEAVERVMREGQASIETSLVARNGDAIPFELTGVPFEADGRRYFMGIGTDITARRKAAAELAQYRLHLEELVRQRTAELEQAKTRAEAVRPGSAVRHTVALAGTGTGTGAGTVAATKVRLGRFIFKRLPPPTRRLHKGSDKRQQTRKA